MIRHDWTLEQAKEIHNLPFPELLFQAQTMHRKHFDPNEIQRSTLLSIKTGGCPENCKYCPQSAHYNTEVEREKLLDKEVVIKEAKDAKECGSTRFCMGAAWREIKDGDEFNQVLDLVREVRALDMEVCCTLGMLNEEQAVRLRDAGCYAYNHNLDTSPEYYGKIITTRTYQDRLDTIKNVRKAGITVCCGGIVGMGEKIEDRLSLLVELSTQAPHPESVPINMLVKVAGTPLGSDASDIEMESDVDPIEFVRIIATARIIMQKSYVRLSAGRKEMSDEMQALCFFAGANSVFAGEKLLTTPNPGENKDTQLIEKLGMSFKGAPSTQLEHRDLDKTATTSCSI